jgi:hypothetical protein
MCKRYIAFTMMALLAAVQPAGAWDDWDDDGWDAAAPSAWRVHGFAEVSGGMRTQSNPLLAKDAPLGEARLQQEVQYLGDRITFKFKADGISDAVDEKLSIEVREAHVSAPLGEHIDVRLGRQVLTWGTGDLLFLNDLFPKDWESFLIGRDDEYLKAPSDAVRVSWFGSGAGIDVVWMPLFEPDRFVDGTRLGYFDPAAAQRVAAPPRLRAAEPPRKAANSEIAARLHGMIGNAEWAVYGFRGFHGQPTTFDPARAVLTHGRLNALGASLRAPIAGGLYHVEVSWHDSVRDRSGRDPNVLNSQLRALVGYERELVTHLTLGAQYYLERIHAYEAFERSWRADPRHIADQYRHMATVRLSYRLLRDNLVLSLMSFHSASAGDYLLRPSIEYRHMDRLRLTVAANVFGGDAHTFFGQFENDSSIYARVRYSF